MSSVMQWFNACVSLCVFGRDKKPKSSSNAEPSGQIGRFKGGVLVLNSKQIQAMNGKIKNSK